MFLRKLKIIVLEDHQDQNNKSSSRGKKNQKPIVFFNFVTLHKKFDKMNWPTFIRHYVARE